MMARHLRSKGEYMSLDGFGYTVFSCEVHFERLPNDVKTADFIEGRGHEFDQNHFNCFNVKLKTWNDESLGKIADSEENVRKFERKFGVNTNKKPKPKPKPKPRRLSPPTPLLGLNSQLGGIDLGLDSLGIGQLSDLDNDMLNTDGNTVMSEDMVDQVPRATYQAPVNYPARARAKGIEGYVVFSLLIDETGHIEEVRIIDATPEDVFNETALQAIRQWRFEPAKYQGKAVKTWAKQRIRFNLS